MAEVIPDLVTTIIPVFNRPGLVREAVGSVTSQTYRPIEIVLVDDGSTDHTSSVLERLARDHEEMVRLIRKKNEGPGLAREAGRMAARGEFIQYLDSDDLLLANKFAIQVSALRKHPECGAAYGKTRYYGVGKTPCDEPLKRTGERIETMFPAFLKSRWWSTSTPLLRRSVSDAAGPWTDLINEEDWEHDCRVAALGVRLCYCDEFVSDTRHHKSGRLNEGGSRDPVKLHSRALAHGLIYQHAVRAGIGAEVPEMAHFARELFLLARQCGAAGLAVDSRRLFKLAREASGPERSERMDFRLYAIAACVLGWNTVGSLSCRVDKWARRA